MAEPKTTVGVTSDGRVFLAIPGFPMGLMTPAQARSTARRMREKIAQAPMEDRAEILALAGDLDELATEVDTPKGSA